MFCLLHLNFVTHCIVLELHYFNYIYKLHRHELCTQYPGPLFGQESKIRVLHDGTNLALNYALKDFPLCVCLFRGISALGKEHWPFPLPSERKKLKWKPVLKWYISRINWKMD